MNETIVILGNGFDRDLGIDLSFNAYCNYHLCPAYNPLNIDKKRWSDFENEIREKILSWYNNKRNEEYAKLINEEWIAFKRTLSKILCKCKQDSVVSHFLYLDSVFKN